MRYMLLIYGNEAARAAMTEAERSADMPQWIQYTNDAFDGASRRVIDGPFAETRELVAGFWLWQVRSLDEAIEWAKKCPGAAYGAVEVRPLMDMPVPEGQ